ncbi:MAG: ATP-binding protein [Desulfobacterales bacterium]|nr:ATP-binding protein [Desulfobacterales bacterium]
MTSNIIKILGNLGNSDHPKIVGRHQEEPFYNDISQHFSTVTIEQYKKFINLGIPDLNRINIFAGINNSGKTTLLEAVYLLAQQNDIMALIDVARRRTKIVGDDLNPLWLKDQIPETIFIKGDFDNKQTLLRVTKYQDTDDVIDKSFYITSFKLESVFDNIEQESSTHLFENSPRKTSFQGNKILCRAIFSSPFSLHHPETVKQCHKKSIQWKSKEKIISFIRDKIDPGLINIELEDEWNRFLVTHQKFDQSPDLTHFGEGIQRIFYIALQFAYAKNGIVLIDEFENAIHKELLYDFTRFIQELAVEFNTQVFLSSHSKECIDAFIKNDYQLEDISAYALVEKDGNPSCYYYSGQKLNKVIDLMNLDIRGLQ